MQDALRRYHETSAGPDEIHYQLLKHLPDASLSLLLNILNKIWISDNFHSDWREAIVIPIPKPGKDPTNPPNYRPIALTTYIYKRMERMINRRLTCNVGTYPNVALLIILLELKRFAGKLPSINQHLVSVFFDLEKVYDTTLTYGIMKYSHGFGLRGRLPIFIANKKQ